MKPQYFTNSAGALLLGAALMKVMTNLASRGLVQPHDPVLGVSLSTLLWVFALLELAVGLACLFGRRERVKLALLAWLGLNYAVYVGGLVWVKAYGGFSIYLASVAAAFRLPGGLWFVGFQMLSLYLLVGGVAGLLLLRVRQRGFLKISCAQCGGHIEFSTAGLGRTIACPHCQAAVILQPTAPKQT